MAFVKVAAVSEVPPGSSKVIVQGNQELALFNVGGDFYCIDNLCPHSDGPLGDGWLDGEVVTCPWHAWPFNVKTGQMAYNASVCVATFPCKVEEDAVLVDV